MRDHATLTSKTLIISMFSVSHFRCRKANIFQISYGGSATRSTVPSTSRFTPSASALIELRSKAIWSGVSRAESVQASAFRGGGYIQLRHVFFASRNVQNAAAG